MNDLFNVRIRAREPEKTLNIVMIFKIVATLKDDGWNAVRIGLSGKGQDSFQRGTEYRRKRECLCIKSKNIIGDIDLVCFYCFVNFIHIFHKAHFFPEFRANKPIE